ncbi:MAG TPA: class I SAM-dependent methyltransferase [Solirubrobacteraceae bacterium]|nr:class I SAM-dependent methyltransferase [Solirubrobacteraceae bacterium]
MVPLRVRRFLWRARREARRRGHAWGLEAATRPGDVAELLRLARGRRHVVELGTGPGWTAIALALADGRRRVTTYDPVVHDHRDAYLALAPRAAGRIEFVQAPGVEAHGEGVELLFVDSTHEREPTVAEFRAWRPRLAPSAVVAFHDYGHPDFPGVEEAVTELGLKGERRGGMFVWSVP